MKRILFILSLLSLNFVLKAQYPTGRTYPITQNLGSDSTKVDAKGALTSRFINKVFTDTTQANTQAIKNYSGAQIITSSDSSFWFRNPSATRWIKGTTGGGGVITSINTYNGDSIIICYSDGSCDTLATNISSHITSITFNGDSTTICYEDGSCVTVPNTGTGNWWSLSGNSLSSGRTEFFGTTNNRSIPFRTNNTQVAILDSNGRFGLGTNAPTKTFSIGEQLWLYNEDATQSRIQAANAARLLLYGGSDVTVVPNIYNLSGGQVAFDYSVHSDYVNQTFISGGATPLAKTGILHNQYYMRGVADSMSVSLKAQPPASVYVDSSRFAEGYGANIVSANDLQLGFDGNSFNVTGSTQINGIMTYAWQAGSVIRLQFLGSPTVKNGATPGAGAAPLRLSGLQDFTAASGDVLELLFDGTDWHETGRSLAAVVDGGGYFNPNQISTSNTSHNANYNNFLVNNIGTSEYTAGTSGNYTVIHQDSTLISLYALHNTGAISSDLWVRPDSIRLLPFQGKLNIDSLQLGASGDSVMVWNKTTGRVGYRNASSFGTTYTASEGIHLAGTDFRLGGTLTKDTTIVLDANTLTFTANTLASDPVINITSNSTTAASNLQKGISVSLTGTNANASQSTYALYVRNTHDGTTSTNYGIDVAATGGASNNYGINVNASGGASYAVNATGGSYGVYATGGIAAVQGNSSSIAVWGVASGSGIGLASFSVNAYSAQLVRQAAGTNTVLGIINPIRQTTGTAADGIGQSIDFEIQTSTSSAIANQIISKLTTAAHAARTSQMIFSGVINAVTDTMMKMGDYVTLSEGSATTFAKTTVGSSKIAGGEIIVTIEANDGAEYQTRTLRFIWSAANKAGTTDVDISTPEEVVSISSGTLTATITATDDGSGVISFKANATSSLGQTTLRATYYMYKNF